MTRRALRPAAPKMADATSKHLIRHGPGEARHPTDLAADQRPSAAASAVTVDSRAHLAAAAYLMRHHGVTVLTVLDGDGFSRPTGIITEADISQASAAGMDLGEVRIQEVITQSAGRIRHDGMYP